MAQNYHHNFIFIIYDYTNIDKMGRSTTHGKPFLFTQLLLVN